MGYLEELASRRRFGMRPGLDAIRRVLAALGNPERRVRALHVAGTNGKGAVCALLDSALRASGLSVGRYVSPHLVRLNERFTLNGTCVDDATLDEVATRVAEAEGADALTFFEALTAIAFDLFAARNLDCTILETGLGGRLDATNVCQPILTVITRIGLDHCEWLGDTVEQIAREKAGIIKPGVPVVLGANEDAVRAVISARAQEVGAPFHYAPDLADDAEIPSDFALQGAFNRENARTALAALKVLRQIGFLKGSGAFPGFDRVVWPGRFQSVGRVLIDGAHNPPAARALVDALGDAPRRTLIAGFCGDKDADEVLRILSSKVARGLAVRTNNPRSLSAEETAEKMCAAGIDATPCASLKEALRMAKGPTLVCGSLFLAGEALVALGAYGESPRFDPAECLRSTGENILEIRNLKVHFPIRKGIFARVAGHVKAVDDVTFDVRRGETLGIVGESGSGKSTIARTIAGLVKATAGTIGLKGRFAMVFQDPLGSLNPRKTIEATLEEAIALGRPFARTAYTPTLLLEKVGLDCAALDKYPHEFSGGQRQRVCIARALALAPDLLICDEAVSALDLSVRAQVLDLIQRLKREFNLSILFITHDLGVVQHVADRVVVLHGGRVVESGTTDEVIRHPREAYTRQLIAAVPRIIRKQTNTEKT